MQNVSKGEKPRMPHTDRYGTDEASFIELWRSPREPITNRVTRLIADPVQKRRHLVMQDNGRLVILRSNRSARRFLTPRKTVPELKVISAVIVQPLFDPDVQMTYYQVKGAEEASDNRFSYEVEVKLSSTVSCTNSRSWQSLQNSAATKGKGKASMSNWKISGALPKLAAAFAQAGHSSTSSATSSEIKTRETRDGEEATWSVFLTKEVTYKVPPSRRCVSHATATVRKTVSKWSSDSIDVTLDDGRVVRVPHRQAGYYTEVEDTGEVSAKYVEHILERKNGLDRWLSIEPENVSDEVRQCVPCKSKKITNSKNYVHTTQL